MSETSETFGDLMKNDKNVQKYDTTKVDTSKEAKYIIHCLKCSANKRFSKNPYTKPIAQSS